MRQELARVEAEVALCRLCYGAEPRLPVRFERPVGRGRLLILGERPARAALEREERIGIGGQDRSTRFLRDLLRDAGIPAGEALVGAAVLCRPRSRKLEDSVPSGTCVRECSAHVRELVRAAQPRLIVTLGAAALRSVRLAFPEQPALARLRFPASIGRTVVAGAVFFHPLYHVSARARLARPAADQRCDWLTVGRLWSWIASGEAGPLPDGEHRFAVDRSLPDVR